jgi:ferritin-like metal-binding protein YciE
MKKTTVREKSSGPKNLHDLLVLKLKSLYDIEQSLIKALPKMAKHSSDPELSQGFINHLAETKNQAKRLEEVFSLLGEKPAKTKVEAIRGLVKDAEWIMKNIKNREARDAALIAGASYVEHYEMAGYQNAIGWATELEHTSISSLLSVSLEEEIKADQKLTDLAQTTINKRADPL